MYYIHFQSMFIFLYLRNSLLDSKVEMQMLLNYPLF
jgi:hypothetical protein